MRFPFRRLLLLFVCQALSVVVAILLRMIFFGLDVRNLIDGLFSFDSLFILRDLAVLALIATSCIGYYAIAAIFLARSGWRLSWRILVAEILLIPLALVQAHEPVISISTMMALIAGFVTLSDLNGRTANPQRAAGLGLFQMSLLELLVLITAAAVFTQVAITRIDMIATSVFMAACLSTLSFSSFQLMTTAKNPLRWAIIISVATVVSLVLLSLQVSYFVTDTLGGFTFFLPFLPITLATGIWLVGAHSIQEQWRGVARGPLIQSKSEWAFAGFATLFMAFVLWKIAVPSGPPKFASPNEAGYSHLMTTFKENGAVGASFERIEEILKSRPSIPDRAHAMVTTHDPIDYDLPPTTNAKTLNELSALATSLLNHALKAVGEHDLPLAKRYCDAYLKTLAIHFRNGLNDSAHQGDMLEQHVYPLLDQVADESDPAFGEEMTSRLTEFYALREEDDPNRRTVRLATSASHSWQRRFVAIWPLDERRNSHSVRWERFRWRIKHDPAPLDELLKWSGGSDKDVPWLLERVASEMFRTSVDAPLLEAAKSLLVRARARGDFRGPNGLRRTTSNLVGLYQDPVTARMLDQAFKEAEE